MLYKLCFFFLGVCGPFKKAAKIYLFSAFKVQTSNCFRRISSNCSCHFRSRSWPSSCNKQLPEWWENVQKELMIPLEITRVG